MKKLFKMAAFMLITVGTLLGSKSAVADQTLTGSEIRAALTDKTLIGHNYKKNIVTHIYAGPNGEWLSQPGPGVTHKFSWRVQGNQHCKDNGCGPIISKGEPNVYYKHLKGKERFKYTVIGDGNMLK